VRDDGRDEGCYRQGAARASRPAWERTRDTLPEYNNHGDVLSDYWPRLTEERPGFQFHLVGDDDEILARARSIPVRWDGTVEDLPAGIDGAIARGFDEGGSSNACGWLRERAMESASE